MIVSLFDRPDDFHIVDLRGCPISLLRIYCLFILWLGYWEGVTLSGADIWFILCYCLGRAVTVRDLRHYIRELRHSRITRHSGPDSCAVRTFSFLLM